MPTIRKTVGQITLKVLTDVESTTYYYLLVSSMAPAPSAPTTNPPGGGWSTTEPGFFSYVPTQDTAIITGKNYYIRSGQAGSYIYTLVLEPSIQNLNSYYEKIYGDTQSLYVTVQTLYSNGTYEYTTPSLSSSYEAAKEAYNRAQTALTLTGNINQYFWNLTSPYSTSIPAGVYITEIAQSQFKSTPSGGNVVIQSGGITLRDGINPLASFSGSALNFYNPSTHEANATLSTNGMILSKGGIKAGIEGQNDFVYLSTEDYPLKEYRHATGSVIDSEKIYYRLEPQKYTKVEEPTVSDLNNYYEFIEYELTSDVTIDEDKNYYIFENNEYIIVDEPIVDNISTYYELINKYQPTSDSVIDTNKDYYEVTQYSYVIVDNPIISEIANYYELVEPGITINNHTPAKSDINIQKITDDIPWREVIGSKFGVDAEGNLYASGANISGAINATSLTIAGGNGNFYNGAAAINISGYSIEIIDTTPDNGNYDTTYLVPYLYHNGEKITNNVDYSHFIWYEDEDTIGIIGSEEDGGIIAFYGHVYRVTYDFEDGAVSEGTEIQTRLVEPSKYITKINEAGITVHPEDTSNNNFLQITANGIDIIKNNIVVASYGSDIVIGSTNGKNVFIDNNGIQIKNGQIALATFGAEGAQIGKDDETHLEMDFNSLKLVGKNETNPYFYVSDFRDRNGEANIQDILLGDGQTTSFDLSVPAINNTYTVTVSDNSGGTITKTTGRVTFSTAPTLYARITIEYKTTSSRAKAYSLGIRDTNTGGIGPYSLVEGTGNVASGTCSHAEGSNTIALGECAHVEGTNSYAPGRASHAEGYETSAYDYAHSEGMYSRAWGSSSHAEGGDTEASGENAHAEGFCTVAQGKHSHAGGYWTIASSISQTVIGEFNQEDRYDNYAFIIGNGMDEEDRSNALTVDWQGNVVASGNLTASNGNFRSSSPMINNYSTTIDTSQSNNGVSSGVYYPGFQVLDKSNRIIMRIESVVNSNGSNGFNLYARNYDSSGTLTLQGGIAGHIAKNGTTMTYSVTTPANFRSAIGAAASSDRRLKTDISPLGQDAVEFVKKLKPSVYTINGERQIGFIAQDVYEVDQWNTKMAFKTQEGIDGLDDWEKMQDGTPTWKLDYIRIIPALTAALQDAINKINQLEKEIAELKQFTIGGTY